jgi:hypothetical protein
MLKKAVSGRKGILSPSSGAVSAHKNKSLNGGREMGTFLPVTTAVSDRVCYGRHPMRKTWEGGEVEVCFCDVIS